MQLGDIREFCFVVIWFVDDRAQPSKSTDTPLWPSRADRCATAWMIRFGIDFWPLGFINSLLHLPVYTVETLLEASVNPKQTLGTRSVWLGITINNSNWPIRGSPRI